MRIFFPDFRGRFKFKFRFSGKGWQRFDILCEWLRHQRCRNLKVEVKGYIYQCQASEYEHAKQNSKLECTDGVESFYFFLKFVVVVEFVF